MDKTIKRYQLPCFAGTALSTTIQRSYHKTLQTKTITRSLAQCFSSYPLRLGSAAFRHTRYDNVIMSSGKDTGLRFQGWIEYRFRQYPRPAPPTPTPFPPNK